MSLRVLVATLLFSVAVLAADSRPVCDGPAPVGTARCHAHVVTDENGNPKITVKSPPPKAYTPAQFQTAYGLTSTLTTWPTMAIVDAYDDPKILDDLNVFSDQFHIPRLSECNGSNSPCFRKVDQNGGTNYPGTNAGWALEISLDVEMAHAICPNCNIVLVEANSTSMSDLGAAENTAATLVGNNTNATISNSWGASESSSETQWDATYFYHSGIAITASSGDSGYGVQYPAASQYVTAVGGTTLTLNADNTRASETVWSGTGSGCSAYETTKPSWQKDTGCANRTVGDVAADADPSTGAAIYDSTSYHGQQGWFQVGGTSLSNVIIAGAYALAGNSSSLAFGSSSYLYGVYAPNANPNLYDVTSGSNAKHCNPKYLCNAEVGYDGPTGNGTPIGISAF